MARTEMLIKVNLLKIAGSLLLLCNTCVAYTTSSGLYLRQAKQSRLLHRAFSLSATPSDEKDDSAPQGPLYSVRMLQSLDEITRSAWNALLPETDSPDSDSCCPFMQYDWLNLLEQSGCVSTQQGWQPLHILIYRATVEEATSKRSNGTIPAPNVAKTDGDIVAALPLYVKYHSQGEFIFDHQWAQFAQQALKMEYYPKLLSAIPMTPATSTKLLFNDKLLSGQVEDPKAVDEEKRYIGQLLGGFLKQLTLENKLSSANVNFMKHEEVDVFRNNEYHLRETIQYRFTNLNSITNEKFTDFDDYLNSFKSKRRIKIKAERRKVYKDQGLTVKVINGADAAADLEFYRTMFKLYTTTIEKMWGSQYLSESFFELLHAAPGDFKKHLVFIVAYDNDQIVAGTINAASASHFYGRYWGAFEVFDNLHFEVCYYKAIEYCIDNGIQYMEPGAGGASFKFLRGFDPYIVNSVHWFKSIELSTAVNDFLAQERDVHKEVIDQMMKLSAEKKSQGLTGKRPVRPAE